MLPSKKRLNKKEFDRFFVSGKRLHSPSLMLVYTPAASFHASAVAPKKIFKTAVSRNKFRRRIYDIYERMLREKALTGICITIAKGGAEKLDYPTLKTELSSLVLKCTGVR
jgi:ribonuclease P protein component